MTRPRLLIAEPSDFSPQAEHMLAQHFEVVRHSTTQDELARALQEFDAIWIRLGLRVNAASLGESIRCRTIACPATGIDHIDTAACHQRGVNVLSLKGEVDFLRSVRATAELTVGLLISLLRNIPGAARAVLCGTWNRNAFRGHEVSQKTIGIVGMGRLGSLVATMLSSFDCDLRGYDPRSDFPDGTVQRMGSLDELLAQSDIVTVHVAYDQTTHHMFSSDQFAKMKMGSWFINTSRSGITDEQALLSALVRGHLAGAALDVLDGEPHPNLEANGLIAYARRHDNLIVVPHIGGNTWESTRKTELFMAHKVLHAWGIQP